MPPRLLLSLQNFSRPTIVWSVSLFHFTMRLNRENTLIENNLYPLAGFHSAEAQKKFVEILKPIERDILQIQAALLLYNIPLLIVFAGFLISFLYLSVLLTPVVISYLTYAIIAVPLLTLVYTLGGVDFARTLYLKDLPDLEATNPRRVRTLEEIVSYVWVPLLWGWRIAFFVYRTFVCPNGIDAIALVLGAVIIGWVSKLVNPIGVLFVAVVIGLVTPALFTLTPLKSYLGQLVAAIKSKAKGHPKKD
jgi:hypothetical protein